VLGLTNSSQWPDAFLLRECITESPAARNALLAEALDRLRAFRHVGVMERYQESLASAAVTSLCLKSVYLPICLSTPDGEIPGVARLCRGHKLQLLLDFGRGFWQDLCMERGRCCILLQGRGSLVMGDIKVPVAQTYVCRQNWDSHSRVRRGEL
jgi:hypothetical protein